MAGRVNLRRLGCAANQMQMGAAVGTASQASTWLESTTQLCRRRFTGGNIHYSLVFSFFLQNP